MILWEALRGLKCRRERRDKGGTMKYEFTADEQDPFDKKSRTSLPRSGPTIPSPWRAARSGGTKRRPCARKLADQGWLALSWPKEYGGGGATHMQQAIFTDEWSYAYAPGRDGEGIGYIGPAIMVHGTEGQKKQHLQWHRPWRGCMVPGLLGARVGVRPGVPRDTGSS